MGRVERRIRWTATTMLYGMVGASFLSTTAWAGVPRNSDCAAPRRRMLRIAAARAVHGEVPPPALLRAVENLKLALRLRVAKGDLGEAQIQALAATIDAAATAVERS